jgi:hypothetical protein
MCTAPNRSSVFCASASTSACFDTVGADRDYGCARCRYLALGLLERRLLDVGKHDAHAFGREPIGESPPDAARRAGDNRHLVLEVFHLRLP